MRALAVAAALLAATPAHAGCMSREMFQSVLGQMVDTKVFRRAGPLAAAELAMVTKEIGRRPVKDVEEVYTISRTGKQWSFMVPIQHGQVCQYFVVPDQALFDASNSLPKQET